MTDKLMKMLFGFNPNQPRDKDGKFGDGGPGSSDDSQNPSNSGRGADGDGGSEDGSLLGRDVRAKGKLDSIIKAGEKKMAELEKHPDRGGVQRSRVERAITAAHAAHEAFDELRQARRTGASEKEVRQLSEAAHGAKANASELASKANFTSGMSPTMYNILFGGDVK